MAMTTALNENKPTRPVVESCSKIGYGYLRPISKLIVTLVKVIQLYLPSIVRETLLNPEPVPEGDDTGQAQGGEGRDCPRRREQQQIHQHHDRRDRMETEICRRVLVHVPRDSRHEPPLGLSTHQHVKESRPSPGAPDARRSEHSGKLGQIGQSSNSILCLDLPPEDPSRVR